MMENAICQYTLHYYHSSIRSKVGFFGEPQCGSGGGFRVW
jgi:hypothetical protein